MKYMFLMYGSENSWTPEEWTQCTVDSSAICLELAAKGQFVAAAPLHPVSTATSLRVRDGKKLITDGPFAETTEQLGGYYIVDVPNLDEAIAIASRLPPATKGTVEIRPVFELPQIPIPTECEILNSRDFAFSRQRVFQAFEDPAQLVRWWGPNGFRNTFHQFQFQPGGAWQFVMHGPNNINHDNSIVFETIVAPERIVLNHVSAPKFQLTILLNEVPGQRTRLIWLQKFESATIRNEVAKFAIQANEENLDRLDGVLRG